MLGRLPTAIDLGKCYRAQSGISMTILPQSGVNGVCSAHHQLCASKKAMR